MIEMCFNQKLNWTFNDWVQIPNTKNYDCDKTGTREQWLKSCPFRTTRFPVYNTVHLKLSVKI